MGIKDICCGKCFCCIPLNVALILIGLLQVVTGTAATVFFGLLNGLPNFPRDVHFTFCNELFPDYAKRDRCFQEIAHNPELVLAFNWMVFSLGILSFMFGLTLIYGSRMRVPMLLKVWIFHAIFTLIFIIGLTILTILAFENNRVLGIGIGIIVGSVLITLYLCTMVSMRSKETYKLPWQHEEMDIK